MPSPAPRSTVIFRACVVNAVKEGEALMERLVRSTRAELAEAEQRTSGTHERAPISDALRALDQNEAGLIKSYPMALLEIFAEGPATSKGRPAVDTGMDFGELTLVDDTEVMAQVELSRAQQIASHATDAALAELNTFVSSAQGLPNVQPERNPFRPENYIRALQRAVDESGVTQEVRQLWMQDMRVLLGAELVAGYQQVTKSLREHGVTPVGYVVASVPGVSRTAGARMSKPSMDGRTDFGYLGSDFGMPTQFGAAGWAAAGVGSGVGASANAASAGGVQAQEAMLTVGILRQMLAAGGDPFALDMAQAGASLQRGAEATVLAPMAGAQVASPALHAVPTGYASVQTAEAMEDFAQLERLVGRLAAAGQASPGASGGAAGSTTAQTNWQDMSVPMSLSNFGSLPSRSASEVLSRMMDHISQDSRLLAPVQRAVQNLEPALKQLVRVDHSFFSNEQHPARRLLDDLTRRSLSFKAEDSSGFRKYIQLVNAAVQHLSTVPVHDAKAFEHVSDALESAWNTQVQTLQRHQEKEQQALLKAEKRELLASELARNFRQLPDAQKAPKDVLEFVTGPWADVIASAKFEATRNPGQPSTNAEVFLAVVPPLLWCAQPSYERDDADRFLPLMKGMLATIRDGLNSIGHAEAETVRILQRMASLQMRVVQFAAAAAAEHAAEAVAVAAVAEEADAQDEEEVAFVAPEESLAGALTEAVQEEQSLSSFQDLSGALDIDLSAAAPVDEGPVAASHATPTAEPASVVPINEKHTEQLSEAQKNHFEVGQWIELTSNQRTVKTQLTWVSPHNTLFLFTALDASTQSMTRRMLDKLTAEGALRKIDDQRVISRALGAVAAESRVRRSRFA